VLALGSILLTHFLPKEQAQVIKSLPTLLFSYHQSLRNLTFLTTPEFMSWFDEESGFTQRVLGHLHSNWAAYVHQLKRPSESYQHIIQSRVAVVDRIPLPDGTGSGCAGIAIALTRPSGIWNTKTDHVKSSADGDGLSEVPLISVTLPFSLKPSGKRKMRVLLRPANTLFVNGLQSTMFRENWVWKDEALGEHDFFRHSPRENLDRMTIVHLPRHSSLTVPLQRLTEPREISMCMGNIISKLAGTGDAESTSASLELEEQVSAFLKNKKGTSGTLNVFALITPKVAWGSDEKMVEAVPATMLGYRKQIKPAEHDAAEEQESLDYIRIAISKGAHLHRVVSGGGGWGKKQGLLSLEPAVSFKSEESDVNSRQAAQRLDESLGADGTIWNRQVLRVANPGDMIEFYATFWSREEEELLAGQESFKMAENISNKRPADGENWTKDSHSDITLGVIPPRNSDGASIVPEFGNRLITLPGHFGMLSEGGMALQRIEKGDKQQGVEEPAAEGGQVTDMTRIDVPRTLLTYSIPNEANQFKRQRERGESTSQSKPQDSASPPETTSSNEEQPQSPSA
jgi:hypothetical protein